MLQTTQQNLEDAFGRQKAAYAADRFPELDVRRDNLRRLLALTEEHEGEWCAAIDADFGGRAHQETRMAELVVTRAGIRHALAHLSSWMKVRRVRTRMAFLPARNRLMPQPLGVVGIVSPWNYPFQLAVAPATAALAAGNRVLIKPSELTPRFSELLAELAARHFEPEQLCVINGDAEVGRAFVAMPFDHLLFTGSTQVGRAVAQAAAANLTPVTLELGGKSPAILDPSCDLGRSVDNIAYGKLLNAGQTCIAPDYLMVPRGQGEAVENRMAAAMGTLYPRFRDNADYTSIISDRHLDRLRGLVEEARQKGALVRELEPGDREPASNARRMAPVLVRNADPYSRLMREEIFGPILPIVEYDDLDHAIAYVNERDRPLALYWFGEDRARRERLLHETVAGGVTINDCLLHIAQEDQPFGGVGPSGMGSYHGEWGFRTFSKEKPVFHQSKLGGSKLLRPPYGKTFERMLRVFRMMT